MEQFIKEEHTFLEYEKLVYKYQEIVTELLYGVEKVLYMNFLCYAHVMYTYMYYLLQLVPLGLFELHCDEVVRTLAKRASDIITQLLARMTQDNQRHNQQ